VEIRSCDERYLELITFQKRSVKALHYFFSIPHPPFHDLAKINELKLLNKNVKQNHKTKRLAAEIFQDPNSKQAGSQRCFKFSRSISAHYDRKYRMKS